MKHYVSAPDYETYTALCEEAGIDPTNLSLIDWVSSNPSCPTPRDKLLSQLGVISRDRLHGDFTNEEIILLTTPRSDGVVHRIPVADVIEGDRGREDYGDIPALATSIQRYGQIQPIVLDRDYNLIAGGRRLAAHRYLGRAQVDAVFRDELTPLALRELELEENIARKDLSWSERAKMTAEIDRIKREIHGTRAAGRPTLETLSTIADSQPTSDTPASVIEAPEVSGWSGENTAMAIDRDPSTVSRDLAVARIIEVLPQLADEPNRVTALRKFDRLLLMLERELAIRDASDIEKENFQHGDALILLQQIADASIDLILTDPPYGTDVGSAMENIRPNFAAVHFDDSEVGTLDLLKKLIPEWRRVLKPNGHLYCFMSTKLVQEVSSLLLAAGFDVDPVWLVWVKDTEGMVDFDLHYVRVYEHIIFCTARGRKLARKRANVFTFPNVPAAERTNINQKPVPLLRELIEMSTIEGEVVLDTTAGAGSTLVAAKELDRKYIGFEQDYEQWLAGMKRLTDLDAPPEVEEEEDSPSDLAKLSLANIG